MALLTGAPNHGLLLSVHITDGVKFLTHDGGTLFFRKDLPDLEITKPITVGNDVYFGNNAIFAWSSYRK